MADSRTIHEFVPKFKQPFSVEVALELDVQTLMNELSRLSDSLQRLSDTQDALREALDEATNRGEQDDPDLRAAFEENKDVIGSQQERMHMITLILIEKGIPTESLAHYLSNPPDARNLHPSTVEVGDDGGIDL